MKTKLQILKDHMAAGRHREALKLAAGWPALGTHKERITRAWAALTNPDMYRAMGRDPEGLARDGIAAICERYEIDPPPGDPNF